MSFPWKKLKKTSISQLAKNHVRSRRIGGSPLMVETGFPTSLVDLFFKNRQRFTKTSKKKRSSPIVVESPLSSPACQSLPLPSPLTPTLPDSYTIESSKLRGCQERGERNDLDEVVGKNMVSIVFLKIFLVVVLVLGTKKLVLGITMSAFLLFFFEYSGERVYRLFRPWAGAQRSRTVEIEEEEEDDDDCVFKAPLPQENLAKPRCSDFGRIHVLKSPHEEEVQCVMEETGESIRGSKLKCEGVDSEGDVMEKEEELISEVLDSKRKKSHKSEMKSKMKRFLAKKLRRKISKELENQVIPISENDNIIQEKDEHEDFNDCEKSSEEVLDATIVKVDSLTRKEQNSASIVLLLVVLVGLIGGRTFALVFTLTWYMMSKQVLLKTVVRVFNLLAVNCRSFR